MIQSQPSAVPLSAPSISVSSVDEQPLAAASNYVWIVLGLAVAAQTAGSVVSQGIYTLVPFWRSEFQLSQATASLAVTFMNGGQIISMIGLGRAIDHFGERSVVSLTMIGMGLTAIGISICATAYPIVLALLTLLGMFYASVQPGGTRAILRWFPPRHRGLATGFRQAAVPLGTTIAALVLPAVALSSGWRTAVALQGAIGIFGGVLFWAFYREDAEEIAVARKAAKLPMKALIRLLGEDPAFWPVLFAGVAMSAFQFTFTASAISFMAEHFEISLLTAASFFAVTQIVGIPGRVLLPYLADRLWPGRRERSFGWIMGMCTVATVAYLLLPVSSPHWMIYSILAVIGLFGVGWFPLYILQIAEIAPKSAIASTVSFASTLCMIAMSLVPFIFGAVVDLAGFQIAWGALILPVAVLAVPLLRLKARQSA